MEDVFTTEEMVRGDTNHGDVGTRTMATVPAAVTVETEFIKKTTIQIAVITIDTTIIAQHSCYAFILGPANSVGLEM